MISKMKKILGADLSDSFEEKEMRKYKDMLKANLPMESFQLEMLGFRKYGELSNGRIFWMNGNYNLETDMIPLKNELYVPKKMYPKSPNQKFMSIHDYDLARVYS